MCNPFDILPIDIIHYEILPLLDYESRITLNMLLKPSERKGTPFTKDTAIKFRLVQAFPHIQRLINNFWGLATDDRIKTLFEIISALRKHIVLLEHNEKFRHVCLDKFRTFANPTYYEDLNLIVDPILKNQLMTEVTSFLQDIEKNYPFKYDVSGTIFINGAGPHHIVDNSTYLNTLRPWGGLNNIIERYYNNVLINDEEQDYYNDIEEQNYYNDDEEHDYYSDDEEQDYYSDDEAGYLD